MIKDISASFSGNGVHFTDEDSSGFSARVYLTKWDIAQLLLALFPADYHPTQNSVDVVVSGIIHNLQEHVD